MSLSPRPIMNGNDKKQLVQSQSFVGTYEFLFFIRYDAICRISLST